MADGSPGDVAIQKGYHRPKQREAEHHAELPTHLWQKRWSVANSLWNPLPAWRELTGPTSEQVPPGEQEPVRDPGRTVDRRPAGPAEPSVSDVVRGFDR